MNMNPQQMMQILAVMQALNGDNTPQPAQPQPAQPGRMLHFRRIINVFLRERDEKWCVGIGDVVVPWTGAARAIKKSDCVKEEKCYRTINEWDIDVSVSDLGRCRIVKASDTGVAYAKTKDFDADDAEEEFDSEPKPGEAKETL